MAAAAAAPVGEDGASRAQELRAVFLAEHKCHLTDAGVVSKALQLCGLYGLQPHGLGLKWESFIVNEKIDSGVATSPSLETMRRFEEWLKTNAVARPTKHAPQRRTFASSRTSDRELLQGPSSEGSVAGNQSRDHKPRSVSAPSVTLQNKEPSGKVEIHLFQRADATPFSSSESDAATAKEVSETKVELEILNGALVYRYQNDQVNTRTHAFDDALARISERLAERSGFPTIDSMHNHGEDLFSVARVHVKNGDEPVDELSVYLQSSVGSGQPRIRLDLRSIGSCTLFPGQVIGVEGSNLDGKKIVAKRLSDDARPLRPLSLTRPAASTQVKVLVAAGPYAVPAHHCVRQYCIGSDARERSTDVCVGYLSAGVKAFESSVLPRILEMAKREQVHSVFLLGPFIDSQAWESNHGGAPLPDVPFDILFSKHMIQPLVAGLAKLPTCPELALVPSLRDAHHHPVFPQPPYELQQEKGVHLIANPGVVRLSGLTIGLTSYDSLSDISRVALIKGDKHTHPAHLAGHLLKQGSFCPLHPPPLNLPLDSSQLRQAELPFVPDVLVVPSSLSRFAQVVDGAVCVNPGFAVEDNACGTAALITLHGSSETAEMATTERIAVEVVWL